VTAAADGLFSLAGRTALVTGGSRGIGRMIAAGFIAQGARVYITARSEDACRRTAAELSAGGGSCIALPADVGDTAGRRALADALASREAALDILVNNAGTSSGAVRFDEVAEAAWDRVMGLNVKAPFFLTQALAGLLRAAASQARPAKVINIASIDGVGLNARETYDYQTSKAALIHLTRRMAAELIGDHIVVSGIAPGAFKSDMNVIARDHAEAFAEVIPARRIGHEDDMAGAAIFLASRAGDYVVGATLSVDGGFVHASATHGPPVLQRGSAGAA